MPVEQKYPDAEYLAGGYYEYNDDSGVSHEKMQMVVTRKPHLCLGLAGWSKSHDIPVKTKVILETAIIEGEGRKSNYLCLSCADHWLDYSFGGPVWHASTGPNPFRNISFKLLNSGL